MTVPLALMDANVIRTPRKISQDAAARYAQPSVPPVPVHQPIIQPNSVVPPPRPQRLPPSRPVPPPSIRDLTPIITLEQGRPGPRQRNEYVDTPQVAPARPPPPRNTHSPKTKPDLVITSQPQPALKKDPPSSSSTQGGEEENHGPACQDSIICSQCGRCRCDACTQPRELPRRWLCDNKCECSAQRCVDVTSCLCCVQAVFYHCFKDMDDEEMAATDDPCACCDRPHCCKRWICLGIMALCLPCLCCYWPLRCGLSLCTSCYNRCSHRGCRCRRDKLPGSKRLLIDSESSST